MGYFLNIARTDRPQLDAKVSLTSQTLIQSSGRNAAHRSVRRAVGHRRLAGSKYEHAGQTGRPYSNS